MKGGGEMDHRTALKQDTLLRFSNKSGEVFRYLIESEIGRGASCIVYEAVRETDTGDKIRYRIKEFYPYRLDILRDENNALIPSEKDAAVFKQRQERFRSDFSRTNRLFYSDTNYASMTNQLDIFELNGTSYIVSAYSSDKTLATYEPESLKECVMLVKQVAYVLGNIHRQGYLYLDTKPGNVLVVDGYPKQVRLFDFDSLLSVREVAEADKRCSGDVRLSYTKGFAPIELRTSNIRSLGAHTDAYGVGALLFCLLFGHTPAAPDCETDAAYDFSKLRYDHNLCDDRLFRALEDFFHHTLAVYHGDRYSNMQQAAEKLQAIEAYADVTIPRIFSSQIIRPRAFFGRESEFEELDRLLADDDCRCLFISGMGGIGKSTFIREYLARNADKFDTRLFVYYKDSVEATIGDDENVTINTLHQFEEIKSGRRYFDTKIQKLREITRDTSAVLVIDNYFGEVDDDLLKLVGTGIKVILLTRNSPAELSFPEMKLNAISEKRTLREIFEYNLGRPIADEENDSFEKIVKCIEGHTLVLGLIAKQIANSHITVSKASALTKEHGFSSIATERVSYEKDCKSISDTVGAVIDALFTAGSLSAEQRLLMKAASLLGDDGIEINDYQQIMKLSSNDDLNELIANGWLMIDRDVISMHRVIQEAVRRWAWTAEYMNAAERLLTYFDTEIRFESTKNNFPQKLRDVKQSQLEKYGLDSRIVQEHIRRDDHMPADFQKLASLLIQAEDILRQCKREPAIKSKTIYLDLLYVTLINTLQYREDYYHLTQADNILSNAENDFVLNGASELIGNENSRTPIAVMELYAKAFEVYAKYGDMDKAKKQLEQAEIFAEKVRRDEVYALYYERLSEYFDILLDGNYDTETADQERLLDLLLNAVEKTLHFSKRGRAYDCNHLYAKALLSKATIFMRSGRGTEKKIGSLFIAAKKVIGEHTGPYADVRLYFDLVCAWYFVFVNKDAETAEKLIRQARRLADIIIPTDLQRIEEVTIPCANILFELGRHDQAMALLCEGTQLCRQHANADIYARMKQELCDHLWEVAIDSQRLEYCQSLIERIEAENKEIIDPKNRVVIPGEIKNTIFDH